MAVIPYQGWMVLLEQYYVYIFIFMWSILLALFWLRRNKFPIVRRIPLLSVSLAISAKMCSIFLSYGVIYPYQFNCTILTIGMNLFASLVFSIVFVRAWKLLFLINIQNERNLIRNMLNQESRIETWFTDHHHWAQDKYLYRVVLMIFLILSLAWVFVISIDPIFTDWSIPNTDSRCTSIIFGVYQTLIISALMIFFGWKLRTADDFLGLSLELKMNCMLCITSIVTLIALSISGLSDRDYTWGHLHWMIFGQFGLSINILVPIIQSYKKYEKIKPPQSLEQENKMIKVQNRDTILPPCRTSSQKLLPLSPLIQTKLNFILDVKSEDQLSPIKPSKNNFISPIQTTNKDTFIKNSPISGNATSRSAGISITVVEQREWLKMIISCELGFNSFKKFLEKEFSDENLNFWDEVRQFKITYGNISSLDEEITLLHRAEKIVSDYVVNNASSQINLPSDIQQQVIRDLAQIQKDHQEFLKQGTPVENATRFKLLDTIFNRAQTEIFNLMNKDSYSRYQNSKLYLDIKDELEKILLS